MFIKARAKESYTAREKLIEQRQRKYFDTARARDTYKARNSNKAREITRTRVSTKIDKII